VRRRPSPLAAALAAPLVAMTAACSGDGRSGCPDPVPLERTTALAQDIRAERLGVVVAAQEDAGFTTLRIESELSVDDLRDRVVRALRPLGLRQLSVEDEGFEAEVYLATDDAGASAVARVREDPACSGRTTLQLSVSDDRASPQPT
jgi:hypothetical protein